MSLVIDKIPRGTPPLYTFRPPNADSPLRRFIALPDDALLVLGARRTPPVAAPEANSNTNSSVAICTAVGFRTLKAEDYAAEAETLNPDILVALADIPYERKLGNKRIEKATDRNIQWLHDHANLREASHSKSQARLFASLLPVSCAKQQYFMDELVEKHAGHISGLAISSLDSLEDLPKELHPLPRLGFTTPRTPQDILYQIRRGIDIHVVPFIGAATDSGIALDFAFGPQSCKSMNGSANGSINGTHKPLPTPMGIDMWSTSHAIDLSPLSAGCECYTCTNHHRAYIQHLLAAKEMLGWVLLQIHNHHVMDLFFAAIRESITRNTFEDDVSTFEKKHEPQLPAKTGEGPRYKYLEHAAKLMADDDHRVRGYQFKSEGPGEPRKNPSKFKTLDDGKEKLAEAILPDANAEAADLQAQGFAKKNT